MSRCPLAQTLFRASAAVLLLSAAAFGDEQILRFRSSVKARVAGQDHMVMVADAPRGGHPARLVVANKIDGAYSPVSEQADVIKNFQPGQLIQVASESAKGVVSLTSVAAYLPKAGEESPGGYVFLESKADDAHPTITVSKLGEKTTFSLPNESDAKDGVKVDSLIAAVLDRLKEGDPVWISATTSKSPAVVAILPWADPQQGKMLKIEPAEVNGKRGFAVLIDTGSKTMTALLPGRMHKTTWVSDQKLLAAARRFRGGATVLFRVQEDGDKTWLRDIQPPPRPIAQSNPNPNPNTGVRD